jgi:hypothetical protein
MHDMLTVKVVIEHKVVVRDKAVVRIPYYCELVQLVIKLFADSVTKLANKKMAIVKVQIKQ